MNVRLYMDVPVPQTYVNDLTLIAEASEPKDWANAVEWLPY